MLKFKAQNDGGSGGEKTGQNTQKSAQQKPIIGIDDIFFVVGDQV